MSTTDEARLRSLRRLINLTSALHTICPIQPNPNAIGNQVPFGVIVGANGGSSPLSTREQSKGIDKQDFMRVTSGDDNLIFMDFVRFRDIFNRTHVTGFCLRLSRSDARFYFAGDHRYNYAYADTHRDDM